MKQITFFEIPEHELLDIIQKYYNEKHSTNHQFAIYGKENKDSKLTIRVELVKWDKDEQGR